ncbi:MAG: hypothetical protein LBR84_09615 [Tannerella sp.]|jgi:hypothetical protein|nr:hypothetical protein [Tannerella sp.]
MEKIESIEQMLEEKEKESVLKSKPSKALIIMFIIVGLVLIVFDWEDPDKSNGTLSALMIVLGVGLLIYGIVYAFFKKTRYSLVGNKAKIDFYEILFDIKERDKLLHIMQSGNIQDIISLRRANIDSLKLRVAATRDGSFCYSQIIAYAPYEFTSLNSPQKHSAEEAKIILGLA